jgi:hypothetical protein
MSRLTETLPTTAPLMRIGLIVDSIHISEPSRSRTLPSPRQGCPAARVSRKSCSVVEAAISNGSRSPKGRPSASSRVIPNSRSADSAQNVTRLSRSVANAASFIRSRSSPSSTPAGYSAEGRTCRVASRLIPASSTHRFARNHHHEVLRPVGPAANIWLQVQSGVQHQLGPPRCWLLDSPTLSPAGPFFMTVHRVRRCRHGASAAVPGQAKIADRVSTNQTASQG